MLTAGRFRYLEASAAPVPDAHGKSRARGTLVLIHGFPFNAKMWEPQLALAEHGWRVIAPVLRGFDGGEGPRVSSMDDYAGDLIDLLDRLHIEDAVIGGLSMGGYVTFAAFRLAPRYFRGLILADTRTQPDTPDGVKARQAMVQLVQAKGASAVADEMLPKLVGETTTREHPEVVALVRELILSNSADAIAGGLAALMTRQDSAVLLSRIHVPTLIVVGEEDVITPPALSQEMHRAIPGSELVIIPGAGHVSNLERPRTFTAALAQFLNYRV